jgi:hypothetical protein
MSIFSALGSFVAGPFGALAGTAVSALLGARAASDQRKQMISDQENQFVRMRNAATKAGFNPLTVMRNGGAQMFGGVPTFSKAGFMQQFVQQGYNAWTTHADNDPLKEYNKKVRDLTLESMKSNIALNKAQVTNLMGKADPYAGYSDKIPVKFGLKSFYMPKDMAERMGIKPNGKLAAGEMSELFGENFELLGAFMLEAQLETYGTTAIGTTSGEQPKGRNPGLRGSAPTVTHLPSTSGQLSKDLLDKIMEAIAVKPGNTSGRNNPRAVRTPPFAAW